MMLLLTVVMFASACAIEPETPIIEDQVSQLDEPALDTGLDELVASAAANSADIAAACHGTVTCNPQLYACASAFSQSQPCGAQRCGNRCGGPVCNPGDSCKFAILQPVEQSRSCRRVVPDTSVPEFCTEWRPAGTIPAGCGGDLCTSAVR